MTHDGRSALWAHSSSGSVQKSAYTLTLVTVLLLSSFVLLIFGINIKSFEFDFRGAFGFLLKFLDQENPIPFSVLSLGQSFPQSSIDPNGPGTRFIQVLLGLI